MVFGADVTHPGFGEDLGKPSVAAVVASLNDTYTEYAAEVRAQYKKVQETTSLKKRSKTQEIITDLRDMVLTLLEKFYKVNEGTPPEMIIFYRDGVSEGQYKEVSHIFRFIETSQNTSFPVGTDIYSACYFL